MASRREYEMLFQLNAQIGSNYNAAFTKAQAQVSAMQQQIVDLGKTQADISAYEKQQSSIEATRRKLETLQQQYDNIQREISETEGYSSSPENQLLSKKQAIEKTAAALEQQTQKAEQMGAALEEAGIDVNDLAKETDRLTGEIQALKDEQQGVANGAVEMGTSGAEAVQAYHEALISSGILDVLKGIYEGLMDCAEASVGFESSITGVYKTVDGTEEELQAISDEIKQLATEIPATTDEIAGVAEAAGQLGIATENVMEFTGVMINLGEATNLTADEAATSLAKFANITGTAASNYSRLGSVIVDLGNNFATTEADIVAMSTRLASGGRLAGLTEAEIMALAAAMSSVGIEAEAGGTAMTQTLNKIETAVVNNGESLAEYARIAGMSADEFATAWKERPIEALQAFIAGLGKLDQNGESAVIVLEELGLTGIRQSNMLKSLGLAADTLASAVGTANKAWDENIALTVEAEKRYATTESQQAMMQNAFNNLKIAIGDNYTPALREMYGVGTDVMIGLTNFVKDNPKVVKAVTAAVAVIGIATAGVWAYAVGAKAAAAASAFLKASIPGLNVIAGATLIVAGLTAALIALSPEIDEEAKAVREMTAASREQYYQLQDLKTEYEEACEVYGETSDEAMYLAWQVDELTTSFEHNKQSLSDYIAENQEANENMVTLLDTNRDAYQELIRNEGITLALVHRLQDLASQTNKTVSTQEEMKAIIDELNETVPDLALNYEDVAGGATDFGAAVEAAVKAEAATQKYEAAQQSMVDALNKQYDAEQRLTDLNKEHASALEIEQKALEEYHRISKETANYASNLTGESRASSAARSRYQEAYNARVSLEGEIETTNALYEKASNDYAFYLDELVRYSESVNQMAAENKEASMSWETASQEAFDSVQTEMEELVQEYTKVYDAALSSLEGQFGLFDKASTKSEEYKNATVKHAQEALDSQLAYWEKYSENLTFLQGLSAEKLGITEENYHALLSLVKDGSEESAGLAANMVKQIKNGNEEAVAELAETVGKVNAEREAIATSTAEWTTYFNEAMASLTQTMETTVDGLQLDDEAAAAAKSTIRAYADAIREQKGSAVEAAKQVANAVAAALSSRVPTGTSGDIPGYAGGTRSAERGFAYVGENGPELIFFNGGERVLTANETAAFMHTEAAEAKYSFGGGSSTSVEVNIHVEGNATEKTVEALDAYGEEFAERVRSVIAEAEYDAVRRGY